MNFSTCFCFSTIFIISCIFNLSLVKSAVGDIASKVPKQGWQAFQWEHVLNPDKDMAYSIWNGKTWRRWLFKRNPAIKQSFQQRLEGKNEVDLPIRYSEVVIIAKPQDILSAFSGNLVEYGVKNQALVWSNRTFPTYIFQRHGGRLRVYDCENMFIVARLLNGYPVYLHDFYPWPIPNPLGGSIRYPVSDRCRRIPAESAI